MLSSEKRSTKINIQIKLISNDKFFLERHRHYQTSNTITIEINLNNYIIESYIDKENEIPKGFNSRSAKIILSEILLDVFSDIMVEKKISTDDSLDDYNSITKLRKSIKNNLENKVYNIFVNTVV